VVEKIGYPAIETLRSAMRRSLRSARFLIPCCLCFFFAAPAAWPQGQPLGPEFRVNTYTTEFQDQVAVAAAAQGFVMVWSGALQDGGIYGVIGQRYTNSGAPLGGEFRVNTYTPWSQERADVAGDAFGNFVVVWQSGHQDDGSEYGIFGQRYDSSGAPVGPEFRVNTFTTGRQYRPSVAMDAGGDFVVVWLSLDQDGSGYGVFGQRYQSSGAPAGPEFRVNSYTTARQTGARVDSDPGGSFVVVWHSTGQDGSGRGVFGQRYDSVGNPLGAEFRVNTFTTSYQDYPAVAMDRGGTGNFIVVWESGPDPALGIYGQRFSVSGAAVGPEFHVNSYITSTQGQPKVAADAAGYFVVVWTSFDQDGSSVGVFGQRYDNVGTPLGPEFRVNTFTTGAQQDLAAAVDDAGRFVVAWGSEGQDGSDYGVFAQRYAEIMPVEVMQFVVE